MQFLADNTVGKLRRWMGLLGYDILYDPRSARELLRDESVRRSRRIVLGRCPGLACREVANFFHIESPDLEIQIHQIVTAFPLDFEKTMFSRCMPCNELLEGPLRADAVMDRLPPRVRGWRDAFHRCPACGRIYWEGTHTARIREKLRRIPGLPAEDSGKW